MEIAVIIVSILLIALVLLQSGKAEAASQIIQGGNADLFANRKERGPQLFITRLTMFLGFVFFILCLIMSIQLTYSKLFSEYEGGLYGERDFINIG